MASHINLKSNSTPYAQNRHDLNRTQLQSAKRSDILIK